MLFFAALSLLFFTSDISPTPAYYYVRACTVVCDCRGHYLLSVTATAAALLSAYCDGCSRPLSPPPLCSHSLLRCHKMLLESTQCWAPTSLWLWPVDVPVRLRWKNWFFLLTQLRSRSAPECFLRSASHVFSRACRSHVKSANEPPCVLSKGPWISQVQGGGPSEMLFLEHVKFDSLSLSSLALRHRCSSLWQRCSRASERSLALIFITSRIWWKRICAALDFDSSVARRHVMNTKSSNYPIRDHWRASVESICCVCVCLSSPQGWGRGRGWNRRLLRPLFCVCVLCGSCQPSDG